ncbi:putative mfs transporter [Gigaspora margarita]|nr:putative mfs transporter [Gigaspora margarita]
MSRPSLISRLATLSIISYFLLLILLLIPTVINAANVISFCKCVCAENTTIAALNSGQICAECNKTFCKDYMKENCSDANGKFADENGKGKEGCEIQVTATCFERDSNKDEAIVYFYITITIGLLVTAFMKPFVEKWLNRPNPPHFYTSMPNS